MLLRHRRLAPASLATHHLGILLWGTVPRAWAPEDLRPALPLCRTEQVGAAVAQLAAGNDFAAARALLCSTNRCGEVLAAAVDVLAPRGLARAAVELCAPIVAADTRDGEALKAQLMAANASGDMPLIEAAIRAAVAAVRLDSTVAPTVLREMARRAPVTLVDDVYGVAIMARVQPHFDATTMDTYCALLLRAGRYPEVLRVWSWARHTRASRSIDVASAALIAACREGQSLDATAEVLHMVQGRAPSIEAQAAFIGYLALKGGRRLCDYAASLVAYWRDVSGSTEHPSVYHELLKYCAAAHLDGAQEPMEVLIAADEKESLSDECLLDMLTVVFQQMRECESRATGMAMRVARAALRRTPNAELLGDAAAIAAVLQDDGLLQGVADKLKGQPPELAPAALQRMCEAAPPHSGDLVRRAGRSLSALAGVSLPADFESWVLLMRVLDAGVINELQ